MEYVVADTNVIRGSRSRYLTSNDLIVIPETVVWEVATTESDPGTARGAFINFVRAYRTQICIGKYWEHISRRETTPESTTTVTESIDWDLTEQVRHDLAGSDAQLTDWLLHIRSMKIGSEYEQWKHIFTERRDRCVQFLRSRGEQLATEETLKTIEGRRAWIQQCAPVKAFLQSNHPDRFRTAEWSAILDKFPDVLAIARWARLCIWYDLLVALKDNSRAKRHRNDWEDAQFAFLASYTGCIATEDAGLKECIEALFPACRIRSAA